MPVRHTVNRLLTSLIGSRRKHEAQQIEDEPFQVRNQEVSRKVLNRKDRERQRDDVQTKDIDRADLEAKLSLAEELGTYRKREELARQEDADGQQMLQQSEFVNPERVEAGRKEEQQKQNIMRRSSPEALRDLRELIRSRHELDGRIWSLRNARRPDRPIVLAEMDQADAIMDEILIMIEAWGNNSDKRWTDEEWAKVEIIRKRIPEGGYRIWTDNPPWI